MRRLPTIAFLLLPLLWLTWGWTAALPVTPQAQVRVDDLTLQVTGADRAALGPFALERLWRLSARHARFGGYSALVPLADGRFMAIGDRNVWLQFAEPEQAGTRMMPLGQMLVVGRGESPKAGFDIEAAVQDPSDGALWLGLESAWHVARIAKGKIRPQFSAVPALRDWPVNGGAEAMARLADGRWAMLCESCGRARGGLHMGLLFAGHPGLTPARPFGILMPAGFDPVDMVTLPDGRLLILTRRLELFPPRFASGLVLADMARLDPARPLATHELARIKGAGVRENYEGMALRIARDGQIAVWLISDANDSAFQETRLMQLRLDQEKLPPRE